MARDAIRHDDGEELLARADALIGRHRGSAPTLPPPAAASLLTDAVATDGAEIPTLTDIVTDTVITPTGPQPERRSVQSMSGSALVSSAQPVATAVPEPAPEVEVISRVQAQNMEHAVHLKLKQELNDQVAAVVRERIMPEIGAALGEALQKVTHDLNASIGA